MRGRRNDTERGMESLVCAELQWHSTSDGEILTGAAAAFSRCWKPERRNRKSELKYLTGTIKIISLSSLELPKPSSGINFE